MTKKKSAKEASKSNEVDGDAAKAPEIKDNMDKKKVESVEIGDEGKSSVEVVYARPKGGESADDATDRVKAKHPGKMVLPDPEKDGPKSGAAPQSVVLNDPISQNDMDNAASAATLKNVISNPSGPMIPKSMDLSNVRNVASDGLGSALPGKKDLTYAPTTVSKSFVHVMFKPMTIAPLCIHKITLDEDRKSFRILLDKRFQYPVESNPYDDPIGALSLLFWMFKEKAGFYVWHEHTEVPQFQGKLKYWPNGLDTVDLLSDKTVEEHVLDTVRYYYSVLPQPNTTANPAYFKEMLMILHKRDVEFYLSMIRALNALPFADIDRYRTFINLVAEEGYRFVITDDYDPVRTSIAYPLSFRATQFFILNPFLHGFLRDYWVSVFRKMSLRTTAKAGDDVENVRKNLSQLFRISIQTADPAVNVINSVSVENTNSFLLQMLLMYFVPGEIYLETDGIFNEFNFLLSLIFPMFLLRGNMVRSGMTDIRTFVGRYMCMPFLNLRGVQIARSHTDGAGDLLDILLSLPNVWKNANVHTDFRDYYGIQGTDVRVGGFVGAVNSTYNGGAEQGANSVINFAAAHVDYVGRNRRYYHYFGSEPVDNNWRPTKMTQLLGIVRHYSYTTLKNEMSFNSMQATRADNMLKQFDTMFRPLVYMFRWIDKVISHYSVSCLHKPMTIIERNDYIVNQTIPNGRQTYNISGQKIVSAFMLPRMTYDSATDVTTDVISYGYGVETALETATVSIAYVNRGLDNARFAASGVVRPRAHTTVDIIKRGIDYAKTIYSHDFLDYLEHFVINSPMKRHLTLVAYDFNLSRVAKALAACSTYLDAVNTELSLTLSQIEVDRTQRAMNDVRRNNHSASPNEDYVRSFFANRTTFPAESSYDYFSVQEHMLANRGRFIFHPRSNISLITRWEWEIQWMTPFEKPKIDDPFDLDESGGKMIRRKLIIPVEDRLRRAKNPNVPGEIYQVHPTVVPADLDKILELNKYNLTNVAEGVDGAPIQPDVARPSLLGGEGDLLVRHTFVLPIGDYSFVSAEDFQLTKLHSGPSESV